MQNALQVMGSALKTALPLGCTHYSTFGSYDLGHCYHHLLSTSIQNASLCGLTTRWQKLPEENYKPIAPKKKPRQKTKEKTSGLIYLLAYSGFMLTQMTSLSYIYIPVGILTSYLYEIE